MIKKLLAISFSGSGYTPGEINRSQTQKAFFLGVMPAHTDQAAIFLPHILTLTRMALT